MGLHVSTSCSIDFVCVRCAVFCWGALMRMLHECAALAVVLVDLCCLLLHVGLRVL